MKEYYEVPTVEVIELQVKEDFLGDFLGEGLTPGYNVTSDTIPD